MTRICIRKNSSLRYGQHFLAMCTCSTAYLLAVAFFETTRTYQKRTICRTGIEVLDHCEMVYIMQSSTASRHQLANQNSTKTHTTLEVALFLYPLLMEFL